MGLHIKYKRDIRPHDLTLTAFLKSAASLEAYLAINRCSSSICVQSCWPTLLGLYKQTYQVR